ncbi:MAG: Flp family type IVb pilin [Desulfitobacteriaceae bacterium]|nr:Flp family type IVb pilin [Desulfitobacteriaceae bacterium]
MMNLMKRLVSEEEGQGMAEYALILGLVVVAALAIFTNVGPAIQNKFNAVAEALNS